MVSVIPSSLKLGGWRQESVRRKISAKSRYASPSTVVTGKPDGDTPNGGRIIDCRFRCSKLSTKKIVYSLAYILTWLCRLCKIRLSIRRLTPKFSIRNYPEWCQRSECTLVEKVSPTFQRIWERDRGFGMLPPVAKAAAYIYFQLTWRLLRVEIG